MSHVFARGGDGGGIFSTNGLEGDGAFVWSIIDPNWKEEIRNKSQFYGISLKLQSLASLQIIRAIVWFLYLFRPPCLKATTDNSRTETGSVIHTLELMDCVSEKLGSMCSENSLLCNFSLDPWYGTASNNHCINKMGRVKDMSGG